MDLNHIQLPASLVADLYASSLVEPSGQMTSKETAHPVIPVPAAATATREWKWLGENNKQILVAVNYADSVHLPDEDLQFLTNMLTACQLGLADVAILNIQQQPGQTYKEITSRFKPRIMLLFDIEPAGFGLPMNFPFFQIQPFAGCTFLYAPALTVLAADKVQKSKLWVALRRLFNI